MSDSIAILNMKEVKEKKKLLKDIKKSAEKLRSSCFSTSNRYKYFDSEVLELFDKYFDLANEIIKVCDYEAENHISSELIELSEMYNNLRGNNERRFNV